MTTTPNPILIKKMQRIANQILSTAEPRSKVTSPAAELVLETISSASPKVRRELLDEHLAVLDFLLSDCFTSSTPTATFEAGATYVATADIAAGARNLAPAPYGRIAYRERVQAVLAAAKAIVPEALAHAFTWGYIAGEADTNPQPKSAEFAGMANPFGHFTE